jgi:hypothetical protein
VIPAVKTSELAEPWRPEFLNLSAGLHERLEILVRHLDAAEAVQQHAHGNSLALFLLERAEQLIAERAFGPNVHGKIDGALRVRNRIEQRRDELVAIVQSRDGAASLHGRAHDGAECSRKVRVAHGRRRRVGVDARRSVVERHEQRAEH